MNVLADSGQRAHNLLDVADATGRERDNRDVAFTADICTAVVVMVLQSCRDRPWGVIIPRGYRGVERFVRLWLGGTIDDIKRREMPKVLPGNHEDP